jgi:hypothetical protein
MKKKIVPIVLTALMLSLTACGTNSNDTVQNVSQGKLATEVVEQNVSETEDTKESKEALSSEGKTIREDVSKESKADAEHLTNKKTESDDKEAKSEDKETVSNDKVESTAEETTANTDSDKTETTTETPVSNETVPAQSQTFNINLDGFGNFVLTLDNGVHVVNTIGWATDNGDGSYKLNFRINTDAQDVGSTHNFEIKCPDNLVNASITNIDNGCENPFSFVANNGIVNGTANVINSEGSAIWIYFDIRP